MLYSFKWYMPLHYSTRLLIFAPIYTLYHHLHDLKVLLLDFLFFSIKDYLGIKNEVAGVDPHVKVLDHA